MARVAIIFEDEESGPAIYVEAEDPTFDIYGNQNAMKRHEKLAAVAIKLLTEYIDEDGDTKLIDISSDIQH